MGLSRLIHGFRLVVTWMCQIFYMLHEFVKIDAWISLNCYMGLSNTWISLSCYMDLTKLFYVFLALLQNKIKLKADQNFKPCWSFCFELKVLNESMPLAVFYIKSWWAGKEHGAESGRGKFPIWCDTSAEKDVSGDEKCSKKDLTTSNGKCSTQKRKKCVTWKNPAWTTF